MVRQLIYFFDFHEILYFEHLECRLAARDSFSVIDEKSLVTRR